MKNPKAVRNCENWNAVKAIDKKLEIRGTNSLVTCPYCGKLHNDRFERSDSK